MSLYRLPKGFHVIATPHPMVGISVAIQIQPPRKAIQQDIQQKGWIATPHEMGLAMTRYKMAGTEACPTYTGRDTGATN